MPTVKQTTPIADWLRSTRERQVRDDGESWSQDDFLRELEKASGWRLHRPNYSNYETGRSTPSNATLARLIRFWQDRGEPAPDLTPPAPVLSLEERAVIAAERQADAAVEQAGLLRQILAALSPAASTPPFSEDEVEQLREMARTVRPAPASRPRTSTALPVVVQLR